ncbi:lactate racemase domain-containing protein [Alkalicoccus chagannorensis]|uniref:lactate racemase domain-containing protein n=1 Tax=Alkalicoccus chagannorensis TaxID=427072 RepID=UPI0003FF769A|nr:lactate racemase domain-containing protein [Alkalicoccus chagannorensis]
MSSPFRTAKIRQHFPDEKIEDIQAEVHKQIAQPFVRDVIKPGDHIAITAGSRGIANIAAIIKYTAEELKQLGANPFIVPAMGSHGGATAEGQIKVLNSLGITEDYCGAPILSSMETVTIGETKEGLAVYMDRTAYEADGVLVMGRIKPHTDFKAEIESGICKMASIGLGKHDQALALHTLGIKGIRDVMPEAARIIFDSGKVKLGVGIVENAYEHTAVIEAIPTEQIMDREKELLAEARSYMPSLPVENVDIVHVDEIGKNFSGTGMDTNIIGRIRILGVEEPASPDIKYIIVGDISAPSHGNALGIGLADLTTRHVLDQINYQAMNENVVTSTFLSRAAVPIVLDNDKKALEAAMRSNWEVDDADTRFIQIPNTLDVAEMYVSETILNEIQDNEHIEVIEALQPITYDEHGRLEKIGASHE